MKPISYLFSIGAVLCFLLPLTAQNAYADVQDPPYPPPPLMTRQDPPPPRPPQMNMRAEYPMTVDVQNGMLTVAFLCSPGEVTITVQDATTEAIVDEQVIEPINLFDNVAFALSAGEYILTVTKADGEVILQGAVVIP